jgi:hypothetical protein
MVNLHHKPIKKFNLEGTIYDDSAIMRLRDEYGRLLITEMKMSGYVPRLDITQDFTIESWAYNTKTPAGQGGSDGTIFANYGVGNLQFF